MTDKPRPVDDLKEGLGLLFRAAKGAVGSLPKGKLEDVAKDAVKEVGRAFESLGSELEKVVDRVSGAPPASRPPADAPPPPTQPEASHEEPRRHDDAYAPEPPSKGPRVG